VESLRSLLERERQNPLTYATLCLAWLDPVARKISLLNMGHPLPFLIVAGTVTPLPVPPIPPLGTVDCPIAETVSIDLPEGWQLFFYTDGLIETRMAPGSSERYGEERLIEAIQRRCCSPADAGCLEHLLEEIEASGSEPFTDDVTAILISETKRPARNALSQRSGGDVVEESFAF
jgi:serine phosphatase RsbU (regulator of sigma subunit)